MKPAETPTVSPEQASRGPDPDVADRGSRVVAWGLAVVVTLVLTFGVVSLTFFQLHPQTEGSAFERVDNLGAYRIPPETGLLIPSDYTNYP